MKKLIIVLMLVGIVWGQGRGPRRGSELYRLRDKYKLLSRQLKDTEIELAKALAEALAEAELAEIKLAEAELVTSVLVFRYEWLCKGMGVNTAIVRDDSAWPAPRFTMPMSKGQKAFVKFPASLTVYYVMNKDTVVMTLKMPGGYTAKVWVKGVSTEGMKQDSIYTFTHPFKVTGAQVYGGDSLYVLEPTTLPEIKAD